MDILTFLILLVTIGVGIIAGKQERNSKLRPWIWGLAVLGAVTTWCASYKANHDNERFQDTLRRRNDTVRQNAYNIISRLNKAAQQATLTLANTDCVLKHQNNEAILLSQQTDSTRKVLANSRNALKQFDRLNNPLQQIVLKFGINYDLKDDPNFSEEKAKALLLYNPLFKYSSSITYDSDPKIKGYYDRNALLYKKLQPTGDSILYELMVEPDRYPQKTEYNGLFSELSWVRVEFYKSNGKKNFKPNLQHPSLSYKIYNNNIITTKVSDAIAGQFIERSMQRIDFRRKQVTEFITVPLVKTSSDNTINSSLDLKGGYMQIILFSNTPCTLPFVNVFFGDNFSNSISLRTKPEEQVAKSIYIIKLP